MNKYKIIKIKEVIETIKKEREKKEKFNLENRFVSEVLVKSLHRFVVPSVISVKMMSI